MPGCRHGRCIRSGGSGASRAPAETRDHTAMRIPHAAPLAALALALAAGCARNPPEAPVQPPVPRTAADTPPLPEEAVLQPRPDPGIEGVYRLLEVGDRTLPAPVDSVRGCVVRVVHGTLSLEDGGFAFSGTTQESCGATLRPPVTHRAEGAYRRDGAEVRLTAPAGAYPGTAVAQLLDERTLQVTEVTTRGGTRTVAWEFRKDKPRLESPPR